MIENSENIFLKINNDDDVEKIVKEIILEGDDNEKWTNSARCIFAAVIFLCLQNKKNDNKLRLNNERIVDLVSSSFISLVSKFARNQNIPSIKKAYELLKKNGLEEEKIYKNFLCHMRFFY